METEPWTVNIVAQAKKSDKNLSKDAAKAFAFLLNDLKTTVLIDMIGLIIRK